MNTINSDERPCDAMQALFSIDCEEIPRDDAVANDQAGSDATVGHAVSRDQADYAKTKLLTADYLRHEQRKSRLSSMELVREIFQLRQGHGRLTLPKNVRFGLYDKPGYRRTSNRDLLLIVYPAPLVELGGD